MRPASVGTGTSRAADPNADVEGEAAAISIETATASNAVHTARYTWLSFLPIFLYTQFARLANLCTRVHGCAVLLASSLIDDVMCACRYAGHRVPVLF